MAPSLIKKAKKKKQHSKLFVLINCVDGKVKSTVEEIIKIHTVANITETEGSYEIIVTLKSDSNEELKKDLYRVRKIKTIRGTMTLRSSNDLELLG